MSGAPRAGTGAWQGTGRCQGSVATGRARALVLGGLLAAGVPHAALGVVVVVKVPEAQALHLQPALEHPADGETELRGWRNTGIGLGGWREGATGSGDGWIVG